VLGDPLSDTSSSVAISGIGPKLAQQRNIAHQVGGLLELVIFVLRFA